MATRFPSGLTDVKAAEFASYRLSDLNEHDLGLISQKSMELILASAPESEAAKAMLQMIAAEKNFRSARTSRRAMIVWSCATFLALVLVGLIQAYVIYGTSYPPPEEEDVGGSCEQNQAYEI